MNRKMSRIVIAAVTATVAAALSHAPAHAQYAVQPYASAYRQPEPLYPYVVPQPYAVAPQPGVPVYPYVGPRMTRVPNNYMRPKHPRVKQARVNIEDANDERPATTPKSAKRFKRLASKADPALVEELRQRVAKNPVIKKEVIVREKPVVVEHQRVVDDPPIVIQREKVIDEYRVKSDRPRGLIHAEDGALEAPHAVTPKTPRVIRAEAEITILGPDRMNIRLFRKRGESANADEGLGD